VAIFSGSSGHQSRFFSPAGPKPHLYAGTGQKATNLRTKTLPGVRVRENEHFDAALRRFKRACEKAGVLTELRRREFYEKPTQERKRKKAAAVKRQQKRSARETNRRKRLY